MLRILFVDDEVSVLIVRLSSIADAVGVAEPFRVMVSS
jgi:hypothetical protein